MSLYDVLGVSPEVDQTELRRAFLRLAREFHPDHHVADDAAKRAESERRMRELNEAWSVLGDHQRRQAYNRTVELRTATDYVAAQHGATKPKSARTATATATATAPRPRDWRSYASPGPALKRPLSEQLVLMLPIVFLVLSVLLGGAAMILQVRAFAAVAVVSVGLAAVAFVVAPLMAMGDSARRRRRNLDARRRG